MSTPTPNCKCNRNGFIGAAILLFSPVFSTADGDSSFDKLTCTSRPNTVPNPYPNPDATAPDFFTVEFPTTASTEPIIMEVNRSWAPLGVDRFYALVQDNYYDCAAFFRVVPDFVVQFGIASEPEESLKWNTTIPDDPVLMSNLYGTISYATAGPDTRTTQLFINSANNSRLDADGFAPVGRVISGMDTVLALYNPTPNSTDGLDQDEYMAGGNAWILSNSSEVDLIEPTSKVEVSSSSRRHGNGVSKAWLVFSVGLLAVQSFLG
ncbi:MAG: hypothetical protein SGILL_008715 [Bacillariaceae sp.]